MCRQYSALALWYLGFPDRAVETMEAAFALCQRLSHPYSISSSVLNMMAILHDLRREFDSARERAGAAINLASEHHLLQMLSFGSMCRGFALVGLGQEAEGIVQLRTAQVDWHSLGAHQYATVWLGFLAEARRAQRAGSSDRNRRGHR
jgi:hypothetical protein